MRDLAFGPSMVSLGLRRVSCVPSRAICLRSATFRLRWCVAEATGNPEQTDRGPGMRTRPADPRGGNWPRSNASNSPRSKGFNGCHVPRLGRCGWHRGRARGGPGGGWLTSKAQPPASYAPEDNNPACSPDVRRCPGRDRGTDHSRRGGHTHSLPGVSRAGLSLVQWPLAWLQALIWPGKPLPDRGGALSVGGLRAHPDHAPARREILGIYPAYYDDPWLQVTGGARYLAQMLNMFDGNIIHALAATTRGPGNAREHGWCPRPFAETQH